MPKRTDYTVNIAEASRELDTMDKLFITSGPDAVTVDEAIAGVDKLILDIDWFCVADIHNEHANDDKDYKTLYIMAKGGEVFKSSSNSLITSLVDIDEVLKDDGKSISDVTIIISKRSSKNFAGKNFYRASVSRNN